MLRAVCFGGSGIEISYARAIRLPTFESNYCGPASTTSRVLTSGSRSLRKILRPEQIGNFSQRLLSGSGGGEASKADKAEALQKEKEDLRAEAKALTLKLYRSVTRSVRVIRYGNEYDEKEFVEREKKRKESMEKPKDSRLSMLSVLPPVDREDELRSRAEYYQQYARENFVQESDVFGREIWDRQHVSRYIHHLRKGDEHRKWLLADMKFPDPFDKSFDNEQKLCMQCTTCTQSVNLNVELWTMWNRCES